MANAIELALMAGRAYQTTRGQINWLPDILSLGWTEFFHVPDTTTASAFPATAGFEAISFQKGNEIVISFAGTGSAVDWIANTDLATGYYSAQLLQAAKYFLDVRAANPNANITLTGHSLGGGLAALVGVFFGVAATTFDQAPFANAAQDPSLLASLNPLNLFAPDVAALLKSDLLASGYTDNQLTGLTNFLYWRGINGGIPNSDLITDINVQGEVLSSAPVTLYDRIGTQADLAQQNNMFLPQTDLHSQALLTAMLQSGDTSTSTSANHTLGQVTFKLTDLFKMIFDSNLYYNDPNNTDATAKENFLERLVRHQNGMAGLVAGETPIAADQMVTRFTADLWKLAQADGLTLSENPTYSNWNNVSRALTAFAMQKYYSETPTSTGYNKQLYTDLSQSGEGSNGVRFDIVDVTNTPGISATGSIKADLSQFKGYELYFKNYITTTGGFTPLEQQLITSLLPYMRDWYVQAGAGGMLATDTLNRGAFMLGGKDSDALVGGTAADLLVGNGGDDALQGGKGNDTLLGGAGNDAYVYTTGDGFDTILDIDNTGSIAMDGNLMTGGVHRDAGGHTYTDVGNGNMVVDGNMVVANLYERSKRQAANDATQSAWGIAA